MPFGFVLAIYILLPIIIFGGTQYMINSRERSKNGILRFVPIAVAVAAIVLSVTAIAVIFYTGDIISTSMVNAFIFAGIGAGGIIGCLLGIAATRINIKFKNSRGNHEKDKQ